MVDYSPIDEEPVVVKQSTLSSPPPPPPSEEVQFYEVDGVMDSELGYMVVLFMIGVGALVFKDIINVLR